MQLLIVHHEPEIGQALQEMVRQYTGHTAEFAATDEEALAWAEQAEGCNLLITQLESEGVDGLTMAGSLGERFPQLHTFFLPAYPMAAQRLEVANTKIFPEPIDGERLLQAIERTAAAPGTPDLFHIIDLLQMCCLSGKSGGVQLVVGADAGVVYLRNGELRHAETVRSRGMEAVYEMLRWGHAEFAYDANASPAEQTIDIGWDAALIEVVMREREEQALQPGQAAMPEISTALSPARAGPDRPGIRHLSRGTEVDREFLGQGLSGGPDLDRPAGRAPRPAQQPARAAGARAGISRYRERQRQHPSPRHPAGLRSGRIQRHLFLCARICRRANNLRDQGAAA